MNVSEQDAYNEGAWALEGMAARLRGISGGSEQEAQDRKDRAEYLHNCATILRVLEAQAAEVP